MDEQSQKIRCCNYNQEKETYWKEVMVYLDLVFHLQNQLGYTFHCNIPKVGLIKSNSRSTKTTFGWKLPEQVCPLKILV